MMDSTIKDKRNKNKIYTIISITVLILLWKLISLWVAKDIILPPPEAVLDNLIQIIMDENFFLSVRSTLYRTINGFLMAFILALILGILGGFYTTVYYLLKPIVVIAKATPTMAIILLALIWIGSEQSPVLVGFLVIFPLIYSNVVEGIQNVEPELLEMAKMYEVKKKRIISELYIPSIISYLIAGASTALGLNLKVIIAAEVLSQPKISMGTNFQIEKANLNTAGVFAWAFIAIIIASLFDGLIKLIQIKIEKWK